ncbi:MAG: RimK family alpha-L-glutamate ligase [Nevskiaceae bacterium]|nr:MAG: RimK family alpha-L-glutamate ligase [Nevskiaceae bacterium]TBR71662.1 MAG: RimK family alpha-L-glutamate ligase [Nevskiaceae bacterium]
MRILVVIDQRTDWAADIPGVEVVTAWEYLTDESFIQLRNARVYNLCRSFGYQTTGYYVSLLAGARGHKPFPDVVTIQDLKLAESPGVVDDEIDQLIQASLARLGSSEYVLNAYFGKCVTKRHERLARALFNLFPAPLLQARFVWRTDEWRVDAVHALALGEVPSAHREFLYQAAREHFSRRSLPRRKRDSARYDLAILVNDKEVEPPSNARALKAFEKAAEDAGLSVDFIDKSDYGHVAEYDALFIRETTAVNHHTYRFARRAAREGMVVIDHPEDILRCANKVFLAQLLARNHIPTPETRVLHRGNLNDAIRELGLPMVLKQPDSQYSAGVVKVETEAEFKRQTRALLERSDLIVAQSFEPTDYDWRIGILDGEPLYACRYFMAPSHWQIIQRDAQGEIHEGGHETLAIEDAPKTVVRIALQATNLIGRGLYGVDLKQIGRSVKVIEVNDNPSIDAGVEDMVLKAKLYRRIMACFVRRLDAQTRVQRA